MKDIFLVATKTLIWTFLFLSLISKDISAQEKNTLIWHCNTVETISESQPDILSLMSTSDTTLKILNVYIHVVCRNDGSGGLTTSQVDSWMALFHNDYCGHKIFINEIGRSNLNNTTYFNGMTDINYSSLISTNAHTNAFDIYLLSPSDSYAKASGIPGTALAVGGAFQGTSVISHEFGHLLGLFHTHSGRGCNDFANCSENIDGSNCSTCGDLICDTPADPCLSGNVDASCNYTGDPSFSPDVHNIMSYAPPNCLNRLTAGQTLRIHSTIFNYPYIFTNRGVEASISGPASDLVCTSGSTFAVNNLVTGCSVSWNQSPNLELYSTNGNSAVFKAKTSASGWGWVEATVSAGSCGSVTLDRYDIWVGPPQITNKKIDGSTYYYGQSVCPGDHWLSVTPVGEGAGTATWTVQSGISYFVGTNTLDFTFPSYINSVTISAKSANTCGNSTNATFYMPKKTYGCSGFRIVLYPNPANDNVTITVLEDNSYSSTHDSNEKSGYTIRIYNRQGILKSSFLRNGDTFNIPLTSLDNGTYIVEVSRGENAVRQQLIINN